MALTGDSVVFEMEFRDNEDNLILVSNTKLNIYDGDTQLVTDLDMEPYKISDGMYKYKYIVPDGETPLTIEFKGESAGYPYLDRQILTREKVKQNFGY